MMQRRKVQRAFTGLVGLPPEPDDAAPELISAAVAAPKPVPAPAKRGRPAKGNNAMTPAERQRARRERVQREKTAPERDRLIRLIVRRVKTSEHGNILAMRRALAKFRDSLDALTLEDFRDIAKQYAIFHDRKGRTVLEGHTGTPMVADEFVARLEHIDTKAQTLEAIGGRRVETGAFDEESGESGTDVPPMVIKGELTLWDLLPQISETMFEGEEMDALWDADDSTLVHQPTLRCRACGHLASTWLHARRHTEQAVKAAEKQSSYLNDLQALAEKTGDDALLVAARLRYQAEHWAHHSVARRFIDEFRDSLKKSGKRA